MPQLSKIKTKNARNMLVLSEFKRGGKFSFRALEDHIESLKNQIQKVRITVYNPCFDCLGYIKYNERAFPAVVRFSLFVHKFSMSKNLHKNIYHLSNFFFSGRTTCQTQCNIYNGFQRESQSLNYELHHWGKICLLLIEF